MHALCETSAFRIFLIVLILFLQKLGQIMHDEEVKIKFYKIVFSLFTPAIPVMPKCEQCPQSCMIGSTMLHTS